MPRSRSDQHGDQHRGQQNQAPVTNNSLSQSRRESVYRLEIRTHFLSPVVTYL
jgi:hypothetical protein